MGRFRKITKATKSLPSTYIYMYMYMYIAIYTCNTSPISYVHV